MEHLFGSPDYTEKSVNELAFDTAFFIRSSYLSRVRTLPYSEISSGTHNHLQSSPFQTDGAL